MKFILSARKDKTDKASGELCSSASGPDMWLRNCERISFLQIEKVMNNNDQSEQYEGCTALEMRFVTINEWTSSTCDHLCPKHS